MNQLSPKHKINLLASLIAIALVSFAFGFYVAMSLAVESVRVALETIK